MPEVILQPLLPDREHGRVGNVIAADFPYTIGRRRDCELRVSDACVSRRHCQLFAQGGRVWVQDLDSLNGTFVNETPVREPRPLDDGDVLRVAFLVFKVGVPDANDRTLMEIEPAEPRSVRGRRVLVVEDDVNAAASLALVLREWGCQVSIAHDGSEAVRAAQDQRPDAVLVDLCLPGMDGYQVARRLREEADLRGARVVAMTGCAEAAERRSPDDTGVLKLLIKPVGADALREVVG